MWQTVKKEDHKPSTHGNDESYSLAQDNLLMLEQLSSPMRRSGLREPGPRLIYDPKDSCHTFFYPADVKGLLCTRNHTLNWVFSDLYRPMPSNFRASPRKWYLRWYLRKREKPACRSLFCSSTYILCWCLTRTNLLLKTPLSGVKAILLFLFPNPLPL